MGKIFIKKIESEISKSFDCGNSSINSLVHESYYPTILQHAYAFEVRNDTHIIGYFMYHFSTIELEICPEEISDYMTENFKKCSALHIEYIAVDKNYHGYGVGKSIINHIIVCGRKLCETYPIRLITLDALKEKYEWYQSLGFLAFDENDLNDSSPTIRMYIDCLLDKELVHNYIEGTVN